MRARRLREARAEPVSPGKRRPGPRCARTRARTGSDARASRPDPRRDRPEETRATRRRAGAARRAARGIWPYATSRIRRWRNAYCVSPASDERRSARMNSLRRSACSRSSTTGRGSFEIAASAPFPDDLPEHRSVLEELLLRLWQGVEPCGDPLLHRLRQRQGPALVERPGEPSRRR